MTASIWVVIPAAGKGVRFNPDLPKQYHKLLDSTVLQQTLNRFLVRKDIKGIVLALDADDVDRVSYPEFESLKIIAGGTDRASSVYNALKSLTGIAAEDDLIAVHDAARPCIRQSSLNELFSQALLHDSGVVLACLATDTIKYVDGIFIEKTLDRSHIFSAQTPQVFRYGLLRQAIEYANSHGVSITDEASAVELSGFKPVIVQGRSDNIKITHNDDLALAEFLLTRIQKEND